MYVNARYWRSDAESAGPALKMMGVGLCLTIVGLPFGAVLYAHARNRLNEHRAWIEQQSRTPGWPAAPRH